MRCNFLIAKLEKLIYLMSHCRNFYPGLRKYYIKHGNLKKGRELYLREIKEAYDNMDVVYDEYC